MRYRLLLATLGAFALACVVSAQDSGSASPAGQDAGPGNGGWGQRGGGRMGRGVVGTVSEVAADHYTIKTETGEVYTIHLSDNTRILKQPAGMGRHGGDGGEQGGYGRGYGGRGNPPQEIKATDIKAGDMIRAAGDVDATARSMDAMRVVLLNPEAAARMREMEANFGKTWLGGKVTGINGTTITLTGALDNAPHSVVADENTTFRRRREPVTLADIQVGDTIRAEGSLKNGVFTATAVNVSGAGPDEPSWPASAPPQ